MFEINVKKFCWIENDGEDDPQDLCLHGCVEVKIGDRIFEDSCTVSATGLYLLRSLKEDHIISGYYLMLPCCAFDYLANEDLTEVNIWGGCPFGTDWSIVHDGDTVKLVLEDGYEDIVPFDAYKKEVYRFADTVKAYYLSCNPKIVAGDDIRGYAAFWNEWSLLRYNKSIFDDELLGKEYESMVTEKTEQITVSQEPVQITVSQKPSGRYVFSKIKNGIDMWTRCFKF